MDILKCIYLSHLLMVRGLEDVAWPPSIFFIDSGYPSTLKEPPVPGYQGTRYHVYWVLHTNVPGIGTLVPDTVPVPGTRVPCSILLMPSSFLQFLFCFSSVV